MNATYHIDHLQVLGYLSRISKLSDAIAVDAANLPHMATTTHYSIDGKKTAFQSNVSYANVKVTSKGQINGGSLSSVSTNEKGKTIDSSKVNFSNDGKAETTTTNINNRFSDGVFKQVVTDMTAVQWTESSAIHSGQVKIKTTSEESNILKTESLLNYANEALVSGNFTHYSPEGNGGIHGYTDVDYSKTKFIGTHIVGGYCSVSSKNAARVEQSHSNIFMSPLGRVEQIHSSNLDTKNGSVKSQVLTDFNKMTHNARNELCDGEINYQVSGTKGEIQLKTVVTFKEGTPTLSVTEVFKNEQPHSKLVVNYESAKFNNDLKVVDSATKLETYNADNRLLSKTTINYDQQGNSITKITQSLTECGQQTESETIADYSNTLFDHHHRPVGGYSLVNAINQTTNESVETEKRFTEQLLELKHSDLKNSSPEPQSETALPIYHSQVTTVKNAQGIVTAKKESVFRADGTKLKVIITQIKDDLPVSSNISLYGVDGEMVINSFKMDLSKLGYDKRANKVTGMVAMSCFFRGSILNSESKLEF